MVAPTYPVSVWRGPRILNGGALYLQTAETINLTGFTLSSSGLQVNVSPPSAGTVTSVGIIAPAAGITVSGSPVTTSGNMTLALADDLLAVEGLATTGFAKRTGASTWATVTTIAWPGDITAGTQGQIPYWGTSGNAAALAVGTDGQVLTTHGAGANPTWADPATPAAIDVQTFNSDDTFDTAAAIAAGGTVCHVELWAAGGSGGKRTASNSGGGGGGGCYIDAWFVLADLAGTVAVTVGTGGPSQTTGSTNGTAGENTTFGSHLTAYGGGPGGGGSSDSGGGGGGGQLGVGGTPATNVGGLGGSPAFAEFTADAAVITTAMGSGGTASRAGGVNSNGGGGGGGGQTGGTGGASIYGGGGGGGGRATGGPGNNGGASVFGGGGGGGAVDTGQTAGSGGVSVNGGNGGAGAVGTGNGTAGTVPGGGGGGCQDGNSGAGADGRAKITVF